MIAPSDHAQRERFCCDLETNFSVVAAAGSGKTRAITDRIVQIARSSGALEWLPKLVVVTFTHRAADEMQRRARQKILEARVSFDVVAAFNRAFFGTIHSFCVRLLSDYGHYLGLPPRLDLISDDDELWHDFVQSRTSIGHCLSEENRRILLRHVPVRQLMELGRRGNVSLPHATEFGPCPELDLDGIYRFSPSARSLEKIERGHAEVREWENAYRSGVDFLPLLECPSSAQGFVAVWDEAFGPFRKWLNCCALSVAAKIQSAYRDFRLDHGVLTYDDQIALADSLLQHPIAADRIRERNFRVILDEAQDTDPQQFSILLEVARPARARGHWLETRTDPPRAGHFCMVGDFQQSIFGDRADLKQYRRIHETLVEGDAGDALEFAVTFRLDQRQLDFVNSVFPLLLNEQENQVKFVELNPRPGLLPGQVVRLDIQAENERATRDKQSERQKADKEARQVAAWIKKNGLENLRAWCWSDVAILCPRKIWLRPLQEALRRVGLDVQTQSDNELNADNPAHAWLTALVTVLVKPQLSYEIVGVLREIFGLSDDDLARFSDGSGQRFQVQSITGEKGVVAETLNSLAALRDAIRSAPLYQAVCQAVADVRLRERLESLPSDEFDDLSTELDRLLVTAATAEADGKTLAEFARDLRANFDAPRESGPARRDAVQLITGQKAKGSEWDAVIVPFLSREVRTRSPDYARIVRIPPTGELVVALGRDDTSKEVKDALKLTERQEMERLLYVALTRARHTLVLAFDHALFHTAQGASPKNSQARWLRSAETEENSKVFGKLPKETQYCAATQERQREDTIQRELEQKLTLLPEVGAKTKSDGLKRAADYVRKLNPSRVAGGRILPITGSDTWKETDPELRPLAVESAATRYGLWWHEFAQRIPWTADANTCTRIFDEHQLRSPDTARSRREWQRLQEHLNDSTDFRQKFASDSVLLHSEMPFLWPGEASKCVEGIVDLAIFDRAKREWLILDWKTNRISRDQTALLRKQYLPQLAAYWRAITQMTGMPVEARIYSSATGQFIAYQPDELVAEWERLRTLPLNELTREIEAKPRVSNHARRG